MGENHGEIKGCFCSVRICEEENAVVGYVSELREKPELLKQVCIVMREVSSILEYKKVACLFVISS